MEEGLAQNFLTFATLSLTALSEGWGNAWEHLAVTTFLSRRMENIGAGKASIA